MPFPRQDVNFVGNLGRDPEARYTPQGTLTVSFSMAVTRQWGQGDAQKKETIWVSVTAWEKLAESCQGLKKGQQVMVKGYLKPDPVTGGPRVWTKQDGTASASYELTAQEVWLSLFAKGAEHGSPGVTEDFSLGMDTEIPF